MKNVRKLNKKRQDKRYINRVNKKTFMCSLLPFALKFDRIASLPLYTDFFTLY